MTKLLMLVTLLGAGSLMACNQKSEDAQASPEHHAECSCSRGKQGETVWCDKCQVGYVKGEKTKDKAAVTAAMAAGSAWVTRCPAAGKPTSKALITSARLAPASLAACT